MIYAIGDLHFDHSNTKPMDVFGEKWINHKEKIIEDWSKKVTDEDLVIIPGDISWGLKLKDAYPDLKLIDELPGRKVVIKGNHDYWWEGISKIRSLDLKTIHFIRNDCFVYKNIGIAGTRGWISKDSDGFDNQDEKIYNRELLRLEASLKSIPETVDYRIAMLHYPPFDGKLRKNEFVDLLKEYRVDTFVYGHLHAEGHKYSIEGIFEGMMFHLVSSDYLDFKLKLILEE